MSKSSKNPRNLSSNVSENTDARVDQDKEDTPVVYTAVIPSHDIGRDITKIFAALSNISEEVKGIEEIKRTTASTEMKVTAMMTRLNEAEARLDYLEAIEKEREVNLPATKTDIKTLWDK